MSAPACACQTAAPPPEPEGFITQRSALVGLIAIVCGLVVGAITYVAYGNTAGAVLAGLGALGGTLVAAHALIRRDR
jgi:hypothetical protein